MCGFPCCCCKPVMQIDDHFLTEKLWKCYLGVRAYKDGIQDQNLHWPEWRPHPTDWTGVDSEFIRPDSNDFSDVRLGAVLKHWKDPSTTIKFEVGMEYRFRGPFYERPGPLHVYPTGTPPNWTDKSFILSADRLMLPPRGGTVYVDSIAAVEPFGNDIASYHNYHRLGLTWYHPRGIGGGSTPRVFWCENPEFPDSGEIRLVMERHPTLGARMQVQVNGVVNRLGEFGVEFGVYRDWTTYSPLSWLPINDYWRATWTGASLYNFDPIVWRHIAIDRVYAKSY